MGQLAAMERQGKKKLLTLPFPGPQWAYSEQHQLFGLSECAQISMPSPGWGYSILMLLLSLIPAPCLPLDMSPSDFNPGPFLPWNNLLCHLHAPAGLLRSIALVIPDAQTAAVAAGLVVQVLHWQNLRSICERPGYIVEGTAFPLFCLGKYISN